MRDPITDAAQDSSCLLCLTPDRGGSWWSRLRPPTPRVFSTSAYWPGFVSAFNSNGIKNYHFSIKFSLSEMPSRDRVLFGNQMALGEGRFMLVLSSKGKIQVQDESSWSGIVEHPISGTGKHTVVIEIAESSGRIMIDGVEYAVSVARTAPILTIAFSNFPGTISSILLESDSGTLWQAAYSDLYDTSNPWPSPVPRNFAEEPEAWTDAMTAANGLGEDNWAFEIKLNLKSQITGAVFNNLAGSPLKLYDDLVSSGEASFFLRNYVDTAAWTGRHSIRLEVADGNASLYLDSEFKAAKATGLTSVQFEQVSTTSADVEIEAVEFVNLTTGRTVWRYPSDAERVRLITKTNVRTDRGAFEAADETRPARVDTALDLRGKVSSYTVVVDFEAAEMDTDVSAQQLCGQGSATNMTAVDIAACMYYRQSSRYYLRHVWELGGKSVLFYAEVEKLIGRHQLTAVLQINETSGRSAAMLYLDGKLIHTANNNDVPTGAGSAESFSLMEPANTSQTYSRKCGKVYSGLLFDRALSTAEIAALTPKKQPLSWAGIRDVVRRGRAQRYFAVGDVLTVATPRWTIEYEVVGFDQVEPADAELTHSMTLLPVRLVTAVQFDAPEPGNPDANRAQYGCNRWDWSAIRQWLNSAAAPGEWWTAQHEYDAAPAYAATLAGFMADLPADFLSAVAPARLTTALSNVYGGGSVETVDRFWPPSRTEIFGALDGGMSEGVQMTKYVDATDADRIKYNSAGTASGWRLRSPNRSNSYNIVNVAANGIMQELSWSSAWSGGIVPACIIA
jgi:hypothetical protein